MNARTLFSKNLRVVGIALIVVCSFFITLQFEWGQQAFAQKTTVTQVWSEKSDADKASNGTGPDVASLNRVFVDLAKKVSPSVVNIYTKTRIGGGRPRGFGSPNQLPPEDIFRYFFGNPFDNFQMQPQEQQALGSGFVINTDGTIVTNSHVVRNHGKTADSIMIKFNNESEKSIGHEATLVGVDESTDVAVLKLKKPVKNLIVAPLGNSEKTQVGEWVVAIGNPYGHSHSVTKGIVSALGRALDTSSRSEFIQTDASINPGNSGGPLFNLYGEVIGINTAIDARAQGIGFAIPINTAKNVVRQIAEKGEVAQAWVGVTIADLSPQLAKSLGTGDVEGIVIQDVFPGEPAEQAGLKSYDVVTDVNGRKITEARDFIVAIGNVAIGQMANLKVLRDGKSMNIAIKVAKRKSEEELKNRLGGGSTKGAPSKSLTTAKTGLMLTDLTPELRRQLDVNGVMGGVVISQVLPGSPAQAAMLAPGDILVEVNRKPVRNAKEAMKYLSVKQDSYLLKVQRRSASIIVILDMTVRGDDNLTPDFNGGGEDDQDQDR